MTEMAEPQKHKYTAKFFLVVRNRGYQPRLA